MDKTRRVCLALGLSLASFVFFPILVQAGVGVTPASLSFGSVPVNTTSPAASIVVTNGSRQSVSILKVSSTLPEFIVVSPAMPITLGPHSSTSFQVQFRPDAAISFSGSLVLNTSRRNGSTQSIAISGMGTAASSSSTQSYLLSSSASNMNFGNTLVGGATSQAIALTNTGTGSVNISQVAIVGAGFAVSNLPGAVTLPAGQSFTVTVSFAPTTAGSAVGNLSVVSSATNSPVMISLSGNGVQPQISVIPASVTFRQCYCRRGQYPGTHHKQYWNSEPYHYPDVIGRGWLQHGRNCDADHSQSRSKHYFERQVCPNFRWQRFGKHFRHQ